MWITIPTNNRNGILQIINKTINIIINNEYLSLLDILKYPEILNIHSKIINKTSLPIHPMTNPSVLIQPVQYSISIHLISSSIYYNFIQSTHFLKEFSSIRTYFESPLSLLYLYLYALILKRLKASFTVDQGFIQVQH